ncbi:dTMP kinase [Lactobacillus rodentium]|uniref:Thymidylate kinase n=1 Tax=Lactobacillus rodentium TaxID=947835 RepID=A0A2Z6TNH4_9LACO|nr:dTMP kinase [Lactobacillus rodentium]MCR1893847.1 dTMP kinase [Lactobacillus rodentium]GBG04287.1 thymidylate kinase [Lactobacillus rodentium]
MKGHFITFEGPDGAGKTTIINEIFKQIPQDKQTKILVTREPGGSKISETIRQIILDPANKEMDDRTEALLYAAQRGQHVNETILPALSTGKTVFSDRYIDSSLAYQGVGRDLGIDDVKEINNFATNNLTPDLTLFFDLPPEVGLARIQKLRPDQEDRLEQEKLTFHQKVYEGYQELVKRYPDRIQVVDASQTIPEVTAQSVKILKRKFPDLF